MGNVFTFPDLAVGSGDTNAAKQRHTRKAGARSSGAWVRKVRARGQGVILYTDSLTNLRAEHISNSGPNAKRPTDRGKQQTAGHGTLGVLCLARSLPLKVSGRNKKYSTVQYMSSYGQYLAGEYLKLLLDEPYYQNFRPPWLHGLELDFYYPGLELAIEFQGDQHFINTADFGTCKAQRRRDRSKRELCIERGVELLRLKAFDLQYGRMRAHLKRCLFRLGLPRDTLQAPKKWQWRHISDKAIKYRKRLISRYDSPSARVGQLRREARARKRAEWKEHATL